MVILFPMSGLQHPLAHALQVPLEDELGDVLEKAMSCAGLTPEALAERSGVPVGGHPGRHRLPPRAGPRGMRPPGSRARPERGGAVRARDGQVPAAGLWRAAVPGLAAAHGRTGSASSTPTSSARAMPAADCSSTRARTPPRSSRSGPARSGGSTGSSSRTSRRSTRAGLRGAVERFGVSGCVHSLGGLRARWGSRWGRGRPSSPAGSRSPPSGPRDTARLHNCYHVRSTAVPNAEVAARLGRPRVRGLRGGALSLPTAAPRPPAARACRRPRVTRSSRRATGR